MTNLVFKLIAIRHWSKKVPSVESEVSTNGKNHNQIPYNVPPPQRTQTFTKRLGLQNSWNTIMMNSFKPWLHNDKSLLIILYLTKMGTCQGWWFKLVFSVILRAMMVKCFPTRCCFRKETSSKCRSSECRERDLRSCQNRRKMCSAWDE